MRLLPPEPDLGPWKAVPIDLVVGDARVIGIDGRSASGKTTLARRLAATVPGAAVVHTDDIAWHHSIFGWDNLLVTGVLEPVRRGEAVAYRPPAWDARGREGAVAVPANVALLIVEGVGTARRDLAPRFDRTVWVQSDTDERERRDDARIAAGEVTREGYDQWMSEEHPFIAADRPWERVDVVACGTPPIPYDPSIEVVIAQR